MRDYRLDCNLSISGRRPQPGKNSFYATDLDAYLRSQSIRNLIVTCVTADVCFSATVIAANDHGNNAMLADCVASYSPERHEAALDIIKAQGGIFGWDSLSENLLASLPQ